MNETTEARKWVEVLDGFELPMSLFLREYPSGQIWGEVNGVGIAERIEAFELWGWAPKCFSWKSVSRNEQRRWVRELKTTLNEHNWAELMMKAEKL